MLTSRPKKEKDDGNPTHNPLRLAAHNHDRVGAATQKPVPSRPKVSKRSKKKKPKK